MGTSERFDRATLESAFAELGRLAWQRGRTVEIAVYGGSDVEDIRRLGQELGIRSAAEALELVSAYFPRRLIEPKTQFGIEELFPATDERGPT